MTDVLDHAEAQEAMQREIAITQRKPEGPRFDGTCHACGAPVKAGKRWCDAFCRDDWQREMDALLRNGIPTGCRP